MARTEQSRRVAQSLIGVPHDTYARRPVLLPDADLVSIELALISAQARAAGLAGILDNVDPTYHLLVGSIESSLEQVMLLKAARTG